MLVASKNGFITSRGASVSIVPTLFTGTKIADFSVGKTAGELYAPSAAQVATSSVPGIVQPDGETITVDTNGIIKTNHSYPFNVPTQTISTTDSAGDTVSVDLLDRAINLVSVSGDVSYLNLGFPDSISGYSRNFILYFDYEEQPPIISSSTIGVSIYAENDTELVPGSGTNEFSFTEFSNNKFSVSKKNLKLVSYAVPTNAGDLMRAMGLSENNTMGDVKEALGLTDNNTVEDAVNALVE